TWRFHAVCRACPPASAQIAFGCIEVPMVNHGSGDVIRRSPSGRVMRMSIDERDVQAQGCGWTATGAGRVVDLEPAAAKGSCALPHRSCIKRITSSPDTRMCRDEVDASEVAHKGRV